MAKKKRQSNSTNENKVLGFIIITLIVAAGFIFLGSFIGSNNPDINLSDNSTDLEEQYEVYNNRTFDKRGNLWYTTLNLESGEAIYPFYNHPRDLENISYDARANNALAVVQSNGGTFSVSVDESIIDEELDFQFVSTAAFNMIRFTAPHFGLETRIGSSNATVREELNDEDNIDDNLNQTSNGLVFEDISCEDSGPEEFVVSFRLGNETKVEQDVYCSIFTVTNGRDMIDLADLFMYNALGVM